MLPAQSKGWALVTVLALGHVHLELLLPAGSQLGAPVGGGTGMGWQGTH